MNINKGFIAVGIVAIAVIIFLGYMVFNQQQQIKMIANCDFARYLVNKEWKMDNRMGGIDKNNYELWVQDANRLSELINENGFWMFPDEVIRDWGNDSPMSAQEYFAQYNPVEINYKKLGSAITFNIPPPGIALIYKSDKRELLLNNNCN